MNFIGDTLNFPDVASVDDNMVAIGLRMDVDILEVAYSKGCFPWYNEDEPVLWWSPLERMVIELKDFEFSKRLQNFYKSQKDWSVTINQSFDIVIRNCKEIDRVGQEGTWINEDIITAYTDLFKRGKAKSFEVWDGVELIGGLYGVDIGNKIFCGESMFSKQSGASKFAFIAMVKWMKQNGYLLIDCQMHNHYLEQLGAYIIPKSKYLSYINNNLM